MRGRIACRECLIGDGQRSLLRLASSRVFQRLPSPAVLRWPLVGRHIPLLFRKPLGSSALATPASSPGGESYSAVSVSLVTAGYQAPLPAIASGAP